MATIFPLLYKKNTQPTGYTGIMYHYYYFICLSHLVVNQTFPYMDTSRMPVLHYLLPMANQSWVMPFNIKDTYSTENDIWRYSPVHSLVSVCHTSEPCLGIVSDLYIV